MPRDIEIQTQDREAILVITFDKLADILYAENGVIADGDVPRLMGSIHTWAAKAGRSEDHALQVWEAEVVRLEEREADDADG